MKNKSKLIGVFSYRYDANLVPDLLKNISFVDDIVQYDDRSNPNLWHHNGKKHRYLIEEARKMGGDWVLCIDPDERFQIGAGKKIRRMIKEAEREKIIFGFPFRELWTPRKYRVDGIWGEKTKYVLFPLLKGQKFMNRQIHSQWHPLNDDYKMIKTDINLYHLKNIKPENRKARRDLYKKLDPSSKYQSVGYDYLADEENIELKLVTPNRIYLPFYKTSYNIVQHKKM